ncbi:SIMPL domain-containing protein [Paraglaciecola sp.]|uniref:SIMPL domain-containing protein n=1 Tax=Paraglaciecola sp. TaxID=1920173 RepID=UPI00273EF8A5|nr:SIMPL domain-containing protein [Paraglaciecola sp.]MDP5031723.1 SIMPL domain-containing protein [Paraglaciecola sp.]
MHNMSKATAMILGICTIIGLLGLGYLLKTAALEYKQFERSVTVKGLSEREYPADIVIWPIQFAFAENDLTKLYALVDSSSVKIQNFLKDKGIDASEITLGSPAITDKSAQQYGSDNNVRFRYTGVQTITVYSKNVENVRQVMSALSDLGKEGIVFTGDNYQAQVEYIFTQLNDVKPAMIEEATNKAREVAEKFASDSHSRLGKIKQASQGQFSISHRDKNNPHIKSVRVVSTVEYYLAD